MESPTAAQAAELRRPPSLYIHDPYGRGQMVRLGTPVTSGTPQAQHPQQPRTMGVAHQQQQGQMHPMMVNANINALPSNLLMTNDENVNIGGYNVVQPGIGIECGINSNQQSYNNQQNNYQCQQQYETQLGSYPYPYQQYSNTAGGSSTMTASLPHGPPEILSQSMIQYPQAYQQMPSSVGTQPQIVSRPRSGFMIVSNQGGRGLNNITNTNQINSNYSQQKGNSNEALTKKIQSPFALNVDSSQQQSQNLTPTTTNTTTTRSSSRSPVQSSQSLQSSYQGIQQSTSNSSNISANFRPSPKPRKNHSAGLSGLHGEPVPVCLDYLKGVCNRKRWRCKFAHPTLSEEDGLPMSVDLTTVKQQKYSKMTSTQLVAANSDAPVRVCEVWALTGFCKFGSKCRDFHPPVDEPITKVCAPATTLRMTYASREAARRLAEYSSNENCEWALEGAHQPNATTPQGASQGQGRSGARGGESRATAAWREARNVLERLRVGGEDMDVEAGVKSLTRLLGERNQNKFLSMDQLLPLLFGVAIAEEEEASEQAGLPRTSDRFAIVCARLVSGLAEEWQRHEFRLNLVRLAESVLHADLEDVEDPQCRARLEQRKRGTAKFLGALFNAKLIPIVRLQSAMDYCARRASETSEEGALHAELGCLLIEAIGSTDKAAMVAAQIPMDLQRTMRRIQAAASVHGVTRTTSGAVGSTEQQKGK